MAQLVEQRIRNAQVVGSSPTTSSKKKNEAVASFFFYPFRLGGLVCNHHARVVYVIAEGV